MSHDETELIARITSGDHEHYRLLVDRYKEALFRHCFYVLHDETMAEDIAQDAFVKAYRQLNKYDAKKASFKAWLFTIATRLCLDELRRNKPLSLENEELILDTNPGPYDRAIDQELYDAVVQLKPKYRTAIILHYWHGYSYQEIAEHLDTPIGSVRGWLSRAKKDLKEILS